jgi:hypothetical protein
VITDAGNDAGVITDAGTDAGVITDAGNDAGAITDAGYDAGPPPDAGPPGSVLLYDTFDTTDALVAEPLEPSLWTTTVSGAGSSFVKKGGITQPTTGVMGTPIARAVANHAPVADASLYAEARYVSQNASGALRFWLRGSGDFLGTGHPTRAYLLELFNSPAQLTLSSVVDGNATVIAGPVIWAGPGEFHGVRFEAVGQSVRARVWLRAGAEPGTWQLEATDGAVSQAGVLQVAVERLSGANQHRAEIDVVELTAQ